MGNNPEISTIIPSYKEGESVKYFLTDLVTELNALNKTWEIIFLDSDTENNSENVLTKMSSQYENFHAYKVAHPGDTIADKANKYMLGFELAKGKYIIHMDADGQDRPEELHKFVEKLDEGYDLVVGHKQKRKDSLAYMLPSKILNLGVSLVTGVKIHDMNNGFKGYKAEVAKSLKLYGGDFRFIPILLAAKGKKIVEVPVRHVERKFGTGKYSFFSRLRGGIFDLSTVVLITKSDAIAKHFHSQVKDSYEFLIVEEY
jgi:glycosyltransferase involved in cell wall biosynthesis